MPFWTGFLPDYCILSLTMDLRNECFEPFSGKLFNFDRQDFCRVHLFRSRIPRCDAVLVESYPPQRACVSCLPANSSLLLARNLLDHLQHQGIPLMPHQDRFLSLRTLPRTCCASPPLASKPWRWRHNPVSGRPPLCGCDYRCSSLPQPGGGNGVLVQKEMIHKPSVTAFIFRGQASLA